MIKNVLKNKNHKRILGLFVVSAIFISLILFCIIRIFIPNKTYVYNTYGIVSPDKDGNEVSVLSNIQLPMGVYKFEMLFTPQEDDLPCTVNVRDGSVYSEGLLSLGSVLWAGCDRAEFTVWLFEETESLELFISVGNNSNEFEYGELRIYETNGLWSIFIVNLTILWSLFVVAYLITGRIREGKISREQITVGIILGLITVIGSLCFTIGVLNSGADTGYHLERIESVAYSIRDGVFPIRLEPYYPFGYGYANGIFYCDLSLYLPALLRCAGFTVQSAFNIFGITCIFANVVVTYTCVKCMFKNSYIGLLGAAINSLAMYKAFDIVIRGGVGSLVACIFVPVLVLGYYRLFSEDIADRKYSTVWISLSIGYTGILYSHILTLEICVLWTVIACLTMIPKVFRKYTILELLKAIGAVIVLNLWFLVPFVDYYISENLHIKNVSARTIQSMGLEADNFLRLPFSPGVGEQYSASGYGVQMFNTGVGILVVLFIVLWVAGVWKNFKRERVMILAKICAVYSVLSVILSLKIFPWDYLHSLNPLFEKLISSLQFPYRFVGFTDVFATITVCGLIWGLWQYKTAIYKYGVTVFALAMILMYSVFYCEYISRSFYAPKLYDITMQVGYLAGGEYVTEGTAVEDIRPWITAKSSENVFVLEYEKMDLAADVKVINTSVEQGYVDVPLYHYKGYVAYSDDGTHLQCGKSDENCVRVTVPEDYNGSISIRFMSPWYWRVAEVVGYILWALFVIYIIRNKRRAIV